MMPSVRVFEELKTLPGNPHQNSVCGHGLFNLQPLNSACPINTNAWKGWRFGFLPSAWIGAGGQKPGSATWEGVA